MIRILARAKINIALAVRGVLPNGYHELETVMQSITLHDEVTVERSSRSRSILESAPGIEGALPEAPDIVEKTIAIAQELVPGMPNAEVRVAKRIPIGAGLGGASADAAATILGLAALYGRPLPGRILQEIAAEAGADVPFCMTGGTALARRAGDELHQVRCGRTLWWVLGIPNRPLSTATVYRRYDELGSHGGAEIDALVGALGAGRLEAIGEAMFNDLERPAFDLMPELPGLKEAMLECGALASGMTGSGSAIIGLCRDSSHARTVAAGAAKVFPRTEVTASARTGTEMLSR